MKYEEAQEWLAGERSMTNIIPHDPLETWEVRIAEADAAMVQQAYWIVKAHIEGLRELSEAESIKLSNEIQYSPEMPNFEGTRKDLQELTILGEMVDLK